MFLSMVLCMTISSVRAQKVEDALGVEKIKFNGTRYQLGYSVHNSVQYLQEYFPEGQEPESYTDMVTISVIVMPTIDPKKDVAKIAEIACQAKVEELAERKETQKDVWNWAVTSNEDKSEWILDFICCSGSAEELDMVEFDIHRYRMIEVHGFPALQLIYYTHRVYGDDIMPFMKKKFANLRTKSIKALSKFEVGLWGQKPSN